MKKMMVEEKKIGVGSSGWGWSLGLLLALPFRVWVRPFAVRLALQLLLPLLGRGWPFGSGLAFGSLPSLEQGLALPFRVWSWSFLLGWPFPLLGWVGPSFSCGEAWPFLLLTGSWPFLLGLKFALRSRGWPFLLGVGIGKRCVVIIELFTIT